MGKKTIAVQLRFPRGLHAVMTKKAQDECRDMTKQIIYQIEKSLTAEERAEARRIQEAAE